MPRALLIALLCVVALVRAPAARAGENTWTQIGLDGATVTALATQPGAIYAGTSSGAVYRSLDGGAGFALVETLAASVGQLAAEPQAVYAVAGGVLLRSTDGDAWTPVGAPDALGVALDPSDAQHVLETTTGGVYESTDGAAHWSPLVPGGVPGPGTMMRIAIARTAPQTLYATVSVVGGNTIWRSVDGGATWTAANGGLGAGGQYDVAVDPADADTVYSAGEWGARVSTNGGAIWGDDGGTVARQLAVSEDAVGFATDYGAVVMRDRSAHVDFPGTAGLPFDAVAFKSLAFDPADDDSMYAGTVDGIYAFTVVPYVIPTNLVPPSLAGVAREGELLSCAPGTWSGATATSTEWLRDGAPAPGTTEHLVTAADVGHAIACSVRGFSPAGWSAPLTTAAVFPVAAPTPTPTPTPTPVPSPVAPGPVAPGPVVPAPQPVAAPERLSAPAIRGRAVVGRTLTCAPGSWSGSPALGFGWTRNGALIRSATAARYRIGAKDLRRRIGCVVTASNAGGRAQASARAVGPVRRR